MPKKTSGKKSIKHVQKKAVRTIVQVNSKQQKKTGQPKAIKKIISRKAISGKAVSEKPVSKKNVSKKILPEKKSKTVHSKQTKETQKQKKNENQKIVPAGHGLEIQKLDEELNNLKILLKEKRKAGVDTFVDEMKLFTIPPKIQLLKVEFYIKTYEDVSSMLSEVRASLESAKPDPTALDLPVIDESGKNPFDHMHGDNSTLPLSEDAKNYAKELGKKGISFSGIKDSFSHLFRKRGGK